jgi:hypothetical protein
LVNPVISDIAREFIAEQENLYYDAYFKIDRESANPGNTILWRKGGLYRVRIGTESGSQKILNEMNKKITVDEIKESIKTLAYAGIKTTTYWVIGHPGETEQDFQNTLDLIEELKDDIFQAECNYFLYLYSQQGKADVWAKHRKLLYPDYINDMLVFKHWTLDLEPRREETFKRVHRFSAHCKALGIPNPYSYNEHVKADERWHRLHENAVPSMMSFMKKEEKVSENLNIKEKSYAINRREEEYFNF